ncbi:MAG: hypothetical protein DRJ03_31505 [Chloroflexi bacterium]|nr:MAG: hypothetical protein DRJ03_31505 [Chloroflexota bacterium]
MTGVEICIWLKKIFNIVRSRSIEENPTDIEIVYDTEGKPVEILKTDRVTGRKKRTVLEYDVVGNLVKMREEWV